MIVDIPYHHSPPVTIFYAYAHEDEELCSVLQNHLSLLQRQGLISGWSDRRVEPGADWERVIDEHLMRASIILLLISPDFLASDYCYVVEMQRALQYHHRGAARVIPILLRPVDWDDAPFAHLQYLPHNGKALTQWDNQDVAFREVAH